MKSSFTLGHIAGIAIGIHYSWLLIFILIAWSLAQGFFPQTYPGWSTATYWITGVIASLLLFVSVLLHELAHSLVAKSRGLPVRSITLFVFGGVSNIEEEPTKPGIELSMAIVGPLTSLVLGGVFWGVVQLVQDMQSPLAAILSYLALINVILGIFNLLPAFPLDGGRVLRSILWATSGNLAKSTNTSAVVGRLFGWALIGFGFYQLLGGNFLGGLWIAFIGWFLSSAAEASRREITLREHLSGTMVADIMDPNPETISPATTVDKLVEGVFQRHHRRAVPVAENSHVAGIVTITDVKGLPQSRWAQTPVSQIMTREPLYTVKPQDDLNSALKLISQHDLNQVLVMDGGRLVGFLSRADIVNHLQLSQELGTKSRREDITTGDQSGR